jgi:hypothetical protein
VATWPDLSVNDLDVTQAVGAEQPLYDTTPGKNGLGTVVFDGVDDNMARTDPDLLDFGLTSFTVFVVARLGNQSLGHYVLKKKGGTTSATAGWSFRCGAADAWTFLIADGTTQVTLQDPTDNDFAWHLWTIWVNRDGNGTLYRDGASVHTSSLAAVTGSIASTDNFQVGHLTNTGAVLDVGEVRVYSGALANRSTVEVELMTKWRIPDISLPFRRGDLAMAGASVESSAWMGGGWR